MTADAATLTGLGVGLVVVFGVVVPIVLWVLVVTERPEAPRPLLAALINGATVVAAAGATALLSVLMTDLLPMPTTVSPTSETVSGTTYPRLLGTTVMVVALLGLLSLRSRRKSAVGTLYYLRYLCDWMSDWSLSGLRSRARAQIDTRTVTAWLATPLGERVDIADDLARLTRDLQLVMADDDSTTGYNLAVNMLWPAAMIAGWEALSWAQLALEELPPVHDTSLPRLSWRMAVSPPDWSDVAGHVEDRPSPDETLPVWVALDVTGVCAEPQWAYGRKVSLTYVDGLPEEYKVRKTEVTTRASKPRGLVSVPGPRHRLRWVRPYQVPDSNDPDTIGRGGAVQAHPGSVVRDAVELIRRVLHECPDNPIILTVRVPKSVGFAIGYALSNPPPPKLPKAPSRLFSWQRGEVEPRDPFDPGCGHSGCPNLSCRHPLQHLVFALERQGTWDPGDGRYILARVHPSQPSLDDIKAGLNANRSLATRIVNLTPHDVAIFGGNGQELVTYRASGQVARVDVRRVVGEAVMGVPTARVRYDQHITGLPEPADGVRYLVSRIVAEHSSRTDLLFPDEEVRDDQGKIVGARGFGRFL